MADIDSNLPTRDYSDGAPGDPVPSNAQHMGGKDENGDLQSISVDTRGFVNVNDKSSITGIQGALTVGASAIEVKVGGSALANRTFVTLYNNSNTTLYWGYTSGVTTSTGTPIVKSQFVSWRAASTSPIYIIASSAGNDTRVTES